MKRGAFEESTEALPVADKARWIQGRPPVISHEVAENRLGQREQEHPDWRACQRPGIGWRNGGQRGSVPSRCIRGRAVMNARPYAVDREKIVGTGLPDGPPVR